MTQPPSTTQPSMQPWSVTAVNLPEHADNPIHTDEGGRAAGFAGALVAGVSTYAGMTHLPASAWGIDWLRSGGAFVRFRHPVLDGDRVDFAVGANGEVAAEVDGQLRVEGAFSRHATTPGPQRSGEELEPIDAVMNESWSDYGARLGDDCAVYAAEGVVHASAWPRLANRFCHEQLVTGSWIHVRSTITHLDVARVGTHIHATANVVERIDSRAGERAVLDVRIGSERGALAAVEHEAIIALASHHS